MDPYSEEEKEKERLAVRIFFPEDCLSHWSGEGEIPEMSLDLFRKYKTMKEVCQGCHVGECRVRVT